ncbi:thioesterase family protein [Pseudomonas sp. UL073]|uniref:Thioesterase family protein n=1 Tax=Zestomonas insulae TaxID=2809017 RepID=A0ABS2I930_9GAMM|nr:thioesterase family protein [Pseudomonas insulae]MBM7059649.1 thioesterase family protein [Pseudomonas insulae]
MLAYDFQVAWADLDSNAHVKNSRYLDYVSQARFLFLAEFGFTPQAFAEARLGPVVLEDRVQYRREMRLLQKFKVQMSIGGLSEDGAKFIMVNEVLNEKGELCAKVTTQAAWFSLASRKITPPPAELKQVMEGAPRTEDFHWL